MWGTFETPPMDAPLCGFYQELCPSPHQDMKTVIAASSVAASVVVLLVVFTVRVIRKMLYDTELRLMTWRINYSELSFSHSLVGSTLTHIHDRSMLSVSSAVGEVRRDNHAIYKGSTVSVYRVQKHDVKVDNELLVELTDMKRISHDNIRTFIGACIEPGNVLYVMQHCQRATLQSLLENTDIKLDIAFRVSFIADLINLDDDVGCNPVCCECCLVGAKGMSYLHRSVIRSHGYLTSAQCFVDVRWVLKVSGFGLHSFRDDTNKRQLDEENYYDLLWTAPELLRTKHRPINGTQKGDVYSFSIILQETTYRAQPFFIDGTNPRSIIEKVSQGFHPLCRPVPKFDETESIDPLLLLMMTQCWSEQPSERPSFDDLAKMLKKLNDGQKIDIVNSMVQKLEKHSENLERLVEQRTSELVGEKRKTELLLHQMLPPFVVEELKAGRNVTPELFPAATIYFSDIVGFTTLSSKSTPLEVVDMLNDLYSTFDDTLAHYDVYKVETIGDAYMVVSGLPKANGDRHVVEICDMALSLLAEASNFKIRHRQNEKLRLRIGIHTGPCAAGVVGHAMPRYCLFGDTVNVASRMESTGQALRIHISSESNTQLRKFKGYVTEHRGLTEVKGKGALSTFWLLRHVKEPNETTDTGVGV